MNPLISPSLLGMNRKAQRRSRAKPRTSPNARVYPPKDYDLTAIITGIVEPIASEPRLAA